MRKTKASNPGKATITNSRVVEPLTNINIPKTDKKCGSCPPPVPRCPNQKAKKITSRVIIPDSEIASSIGGPVSIEEIEISTMTIPNVELDDFKGDFTYESCKAKNVEIAITLSISSSFSGTIHTPWWMPDLHPSGTVDFASFTETQPLGDIEFQSGSISMQSPKMTMGPFSMTPEPIRRTIIEEVTAEKVQMKCTSIPLDSPLCKTLGVCLPMLNPMCPNNVITEETNIERMDSKNISSSHIVMNNISALNIEIPSVTTKGFKAISTTPITITTSKNTFGPKVTRTGDAENADITTVMTLKIEKVVMNVKDGMEISNIKGKVTTASAISDKLDINLVLKRIKIKGLNLCGMKIPEIEVEF
ncbi:MAG: hypothetical protein PHH85_11415 [Candidatus Methanoperedens sp.]|nr:hypothetical protein [Candidatus Methanoperedens sp.]